MLIGVIVGSCGFFVLLALLCWLRHRYGQYLDDRAVVLRDWINQDAGGRVLVFSKTGSIMKTSDSEFSFDKVYSTRLESIEQDKDDD